MVLDELYCIGMIAYITAVDLFHLGLNHSHVALVPARSLANASPGVDMIFYVY